MRRRLQLTAFALAAGCATNAPRPAAQDRYHDRYSPDRMRSGPSMTETGRFGVTSVSRGGVHIEDARADGAVPAAPTRSRRSRHGTRTSDRKRTTPR